MQRILLNRSTERSIFHTPANISFRLKSGYCRGQVSFGIQSVREMKLEPNGYVEMEIEDDVWFVRKTVSNNGFKLFRVGREGNKGLAANCNKVVRGFYAAHHKPVDKILKCRIEVEEIRGAKPDYPRFKIIVK